MKYEFLNNAPSANPVFFRSYSRQKDDGTRETFKEVSERVIDGLAELGKLDIEEVEIITDALARKQMLPSGRWLWCGGTEWSKQPKNYSGAYNCTSTEVVDNDAFGLMMDLAMMGSGTGAILEDNFISKLPVIRNYIQIDEVIDVGSSSAENRHERTYVDYRGNTVIIKVGDSRRGWVDAYQATIDAATDFDFDNKRPVHIHVDLSSIRPAGEKLKGFGGTSNPIKLRDLFYRVAEILTAAVGRKLTAVECCLLIDEAATVVVAGNIRRSAGMRQFSFDNQQANKAKDNLWQQDAEGNWKIDPKRDALRMANHTRVYHKKPSLEEVTEAVRKQFYSGEGAIQYAPEAIARSNSDLLNSTRKKGRFITIYENLGKESAAEYLWAINDARGNPPMDDVELNHRLHRYGLNPCGEIIGTNFHCNLSEIHLNRIDPSDYAAQEQAFKAGAIVAAALLHHRFEEPRYRESRQLDPIVGVSFTGLFDFFVHAFGKDWLRWFVAGRPETPEGKAFKATEVSYLKRWRIVVDKTIKEYCEKHGLRVPNRSTTVQPAGTKSLLTGASSGWHPPKGQRFIRRITFGKNHPIALACMDYGYNVVPSQSDKDELGRLLDNPFDERCTEWLVEIPTEVSWASIEGCAEIDISAISAAAQYDFYMQVQKHYTAHNTSATIEYTIGEIEELSKLIYDSIQNDEGYISAALLARFEANETFPRLPFEPISKEEFLELEAEVLRRRTNEDFIDALSKHDKGDDYEAGPAPCDSDKCLIPGADGS